jgi:hypothetical protein
MTVQDRTEWVVMPVAAMLAFPLLICRVGAGIRYDSHVFAHFYGRACVGLSDRSV